MLPQNVIQLLENWFPEYLNYVAMEYRSASGLKSWCITTTKVSFVHTFHRQLLEAIQLYHVPLSLHDPVLITMATPLKFCGDHVRRSSCNNYHSTPRITREGSEALWEAFKHLEIAWVEQTDPEQDYGTYFYLPFSNIVMLYRPLSGLSYVFVLLFLTRLSFRVWVASN